MGSKARIETQLEIALLAILLKLPRTIMGLISVSNKGRIARWGEFSAVTVL